MKNGTNTRELQAVKKKYSIVGNCQALNQALEMALRVAPSDVPLLIVGENGVGKDIFSRIIHDHSYRKSKKFMAINCGSIPPGTINSELFGHVRGAYTSAESDRKGYFAECDGGTLFLDEIGELPKETQSLLLRVLENGEYIPVGSDKVLKTNVRIVAATNVDLLKAMSVGKFREDLFFRLNGLTINIPPLRDRGDDIMMLFKRFAFEMSEKYMKDDVIELDAEAEEMFKKYYWPGNVRQLRNLVESLTFIVADNKVTANTLKTILPENKGTELLYTQDFGSYESDQSSIYRWLIQLTTNYRQLRKEVAELRRAMGLSAEGMAMNRSGRSLMLTDETNKVDEAEYVDSYETIEEMEKSAIIASLKRNGGSRRKVANELDMSERTLYRKIQAYGLEDVK